MLQIHAVKAFNDNYIWLIQSAQNQDVLIVDPGDAGPVINFIEKNDLQPAAILVTHHHSDHVGGIRRLDDLYDLPVYGPQREHIKTVDTPLYAQADQLLHASFAHFRVIDTPGHTPGHISYLIEDNLFCGDTLFAGGCGRLLGGTAEQLFDSLEKIKQLNDKTQLYCAHEYTLANLKFAITVDPENPALLERLAHTEALREQGLATVPSVLEEEIHTNPFLRCDNIEIKKAAEAYAGQPLDTPLAVFSVLRAWKDAF
ncbi:hydroxyacylglutathione hydrolase [Methylophaga pinxianii]|uniref:hydroxyacylglutathione hydrolase n=1 Tax=Methylophaga pinxianii TaxID=2881052 RepID=UPI001CF56018|nr:hydroxyacylglutathione hydrolase [Methylophaga pinxianii]MCB2426401.1 hydroxyacylglutathione hydrolase [Methylophaga pinxianii]UPH45771.1 hydroxyacylglutathione hydrolase [Methylophaga pinxianii]